MIPNKHATYLICLVILLSGCVTTDTVIKSSTEAPTYKYGISTDPWDLPITASVPVGYECLEGQTMVYQRGTDEKQSVWCMDSNNLADAQL